jgi:hypothetical protein
LKSSARFPVADTVIRGRYHRRNHERNNCYV